MVHPGSAHCVGVRMTAETIVTALAILVITVVALFCYHMHDDQVTGMQACEAKGGVAVVQARAGYACLKKEALVP